MSTQDALTALAGLAGVVTYLCVRRARRWAFTFRPHGKWRRRSD